MPVRPVFRKMRILCFFSREASVAYTCDTEKLLANRAVAGPRHSHGKMKIFIPMGSPPGWQ